MVLVTGATGILGRVIVLELLKRGKSVRAAKRATSNLQEVRDSLRFYTNNPDVFFDQIHWVDVDFEDIFSLKKALEDIDEVYHCAAFVSFNPKDCRKIFQTNIEGTKQLLYACENSVKKFLFVSSIAVLDGLNEQGVTDETCDYNPKTEHSEYASSKHFSEMEVWRASAEGMNVAIVNPGLIIGSGNWGASSGTIFKKYLDNSYSFSGSTAYVDVRDVAKISVDLMEKNIFGERFILTSENVKYYEMANLIRRKAQIKDVKLAPLYALKAGIVLNRLFGWLIPPLRMATKTNIEAITTDSKISNQKIVNRLDYDFIPIEESVDFHLKNYLSK